MGDFILKVENVSKKFVRKDGSEFWALKNVSFELKRGETLGIIGQNGSGKSTLLKILSGLIKPTSGKVTLNGKASSILDIGAGFHPELTGEDNIFIVGRLLGLDKQQVKESKQEIIDFSDIGDSIYQQVKYYSNGMFLRLAFSIVTILESEIILLDEVLSVGDLDFKLKSFEKLKSLRNSERGLLIAGHNLQETQILANRCIWLEDGQIVAAGDVKETINAYCIGETETHFSHLSEGGKMEKLRISNICTIWNSIGVGENNSVIIPESARIEDAVGNLIEKVNIYDSFAVRVVFSTMAPVENLQCILNIHNTDGNELVAASWLFDKDYTPQKTDPGRYEALFRFPSSMFHEGFYFAGLIFSSQDQDSFARYYPVLKLEIVYPPEKELQKWDRQLSCVSFSESSLGPL